MKTIFFTFIRRIFFIRVKSHHSDKTWREKQKVTEVDEIIRDLLVELS